MILELRKVEGTSEHSQARIRPRLELLRAA